MITATLQWRSVTQRERQFMVWSHPFVLSFRSMAHGSRSYIARSALASFLLEVARTHERDIGGLTVDFAENQMTGYNWRVTGIDPGDVDRPVAEAIVCSVVYANSFWIMVEDGSPLDGDVERPDQDRRQPRMTTHDP